MHADEGHDIINCINMKTALESHGGVKGTKAFIVSIDQQMEPKTNGTKDKDKDSRNQQL